MASPAVKSYGAHPEDEGLTSANQGAKTGASLGAKAGQVGTFTLASRLLGFLRWVVQAATVGSGAMAGAYSSANQIPNVFYEVVVGGALAGTVVPLLAGAIAHGQREKVRETASGLLGLTLAVLLPLAVLMALFAEPLAQLLVTSDTRMGADKAAIAYWGGSHQLVVAFLRMFALQIPLYGLGVVLTGVLQAYNRFTWPALAPIFSSLVVMLTYGIYGALIDAGHYAQAVLTLGWGTTAGVAALSLPLLWPVHRLGLGLRARLRLPAGTFTQLRSLAGAGIAALIAQQISVLTVVAVARRYGSAGTIAIYQYTQAIYVLPYAVLAVPLATVVYPQLAARLAAKHVSRETKDLIANSTALVTLAACVGSGALMLGAPVAQQVFGLITTVDYMGAALVAFAPGLVGYALIYQLTRVLYVLDAARSAALATCLGWLVVAGASWMFSANAKGAAVLVYLGAASSAGMSLAGVALALVLARRVGARALVPSLKIVALYLVVSAPALALAQLLDPTSALGIVGLLALALAVAGVIALGGVRLVPQSIKVLRSRKALAKTEQE
jgi:virulence factor MVIN family protein (fragment)